MAARASPYLDFRPGGLPSHDRGSGLADDLCERGPYREFRNGLRLGDCCRGEKPKLCTTHLK